MRKIGVAARAASRELARADAASKNRALNAAAEEIRRRAKQIVKANATDVAGAKRKKHDAAFIDRLTLSEQSVEQMAAGVEEVAALEDPVGRISERATRPTGIEVARMRVPLGVIGIIYESRPNVTADAAALCVKSGNACILRGGSEALAANRVIHRVLADALGPSGLPPHAVQLVPTTDREAVGLLLGMPDRIDLAIPRGG